MKQCKLVIKDEVNVKLEGLELTDRKALANMFKFDIPGARYLPAVRLGRWDGKVSFFQLSGSTYTNLLPEVIPYLVDKAYDIDIVDIREYSTTFEFTQVDENSFNHINWPQGHPKQGQPIQLRDYQVEILNKFLTNPQCIQEVATGAGKTIITAALSYCVEKYGRSIVIVPNKSLVTQTEVDYKNLGLDVGVYFGDRKELGRTHTICTWQSLNILNKKSKDDDEIINLSEFLDGVKTVIVDEVHMAKADALKSLLTGAFSQVPIRWGLTGTVPKEDFEFIALKCSIGEVIGRLSASELQKDGHLANCDINILQLVDYVEYKNYQDELRYLLENSDRLAYISKLVESIRKNGNTLVLVDRVGPGKELTKMIKDAVFVSGSTKSNDRKEEYDLVATSDDKVIVATYGVAAVGINIPRIFNLILVEPGKSFVRVIQSIGRGIRKAEDKDHVTIWDVTSTCKFAKKHLTTRKKYYNEANYPFTLQKVEWQK